MTGLLFCRTSVSKVSSVTTLVAPILITPSVLYLLPWPAELSGSRVLLRQPPFGVDRGRTAGARRGDGLPVGPVHNVTAGEDSLDRGARARLVDEQVAVGVGGELAGVQLAARRVADGDEYAADRQHLLLAGADVLDPQSGELALADHLDDLGVTQELDLGVRQRPVLHDLGGAQRATPVHDRHRLGEPGEEHRLLERRVAAADHRDVPLPEEEPVAGRAERHAAPGELLLAR